MDSTVFDVFQVTPYEFLEISRGEVYGNTIVETFSATGVFKLRDGMTTNNNQEAYQSTATLHIRPSEPFVTSLNSVLVGHGIRYDGIEYDIIGATGGRNFDNNELEHYTLTLQVSEFQQDESS